MRGHAKVECNLCVLRQVRLIKYDIKVSLELNQWSKVGFALNFVSVILIEVLGAIRTSTTEEQQQH